MSISSGCCHASGEEKDVWVDFEVVRGRGEMSDRISDRCWRDWAGVRGLKLAENGEGGKREKLVLGGVMATGGLANAKSTFERNLEVASRMGIVSLDGKDGVEEERFFS
jgi:hypothetical protein